MSDEITLPIGKVLKVEGNTVTGVLYDSKIKCPFVEQVKKRKGRNTSVEIPEPSIFLDNIKYHKSQTLADVEKQWVLLSLKEFNGNISEAARHLGISKCKVYRYLGRKYY